MGIPISKHVCSRCAKVEPGLIWGRPRLYQLEIGKQIPLFCKLGWCVDCDGLRHVEDLDMARPLESLRRVSTSLSSAKSRWRWFSTAWDCQSFNSFDDKTPYVREFGEEDWHEMGEILDEVANRINYLSQRTNPPRCLKCSGQNIFDLETTNFAGENRWMHPGCGGAFVLEITGSINCGPISTKAIYNPDGIFTHEETFEPRNLIKPSNLD